MSTDIEFEQHTTVYTSKAVHPIDNTAIIYIMQVNVRLLQWYMDSWSCVN